MSLVFYKKLSSESFVAVWQADQDWQRYTDELTVSSQEKQALDSMKDFRKKEWLSCRMLLSHCLEKKVQLVKDENGKPWILGDDNFISISHAQNMAAAIYHPKAVGIDIQHRKTKIKRIAQKFIYPDQIVGIPEGQDLDYLHYYWGAKESLFKAYGKNGIDFKKHLQVDKPKLPGSKVGIASIHKNEYKAHFNTTLEIIQDHYLVYVIQNA